MKDSAQLRRQLHLIRFLDKPHGYPSIARICDHLRDHDIASVSVASVERDIRAIRADYDITITYDRRKRGYFIDLPIDEDVSNFREYVRLLERRERLETLTQPGRSMMATPSLAVAVEAVIPVKLRTSACATTESSRRSATA